MGESCLMQPFSYASGIPNDEANQANPMHALGESVSFGRFVSESLSWEKWSTFSQNRYVEEAERYAKPGSVAQKKAFFEAHYKRIAAQKAAALLEQANAANNASVQEDEGGNCENENTTTHDVQTTMLSSQVDIEAKENIVINTNGYNPNVKPVDLEVKEHEVLVKNHKSSESLKQLENIEEQSMSSGLELSGTTEVEKPLLKKHVNNNQEAMSKRKPDISSSKSSICRKASKDLFSPAKSRAPFHPRKENIATPTTKKFTIDSTDRKRSTPNTLRTLMNFTPAREADKLATPAIRKIENSRVAPTSYKPSKDCSTPLRTPYTASINGVQKHPSATPCSENRRNKTPLNPLASGSKTTGPKWGMLSAVRSCSKSISACRKKLQSSTLSSPFVLKTEERAARRKQKLEEKFNDKEAQKVPLQTNFKEKAETEVSKLRQRLCFKARPLPDFYKEREKPKNQTNKSPRMQQQSLKLGKKTSANKITVPPSVSSTKNKNIASKNLLKRNGQTPVHYLSTLSEMITHENTSPNIRH